MTMSRATATRRRSSSSSSSSTSSHSNSSSSSTTSKAAARLSLVVALLCAATLPVVAERCSDGPFYAYLDNKDFLMAKCGSYAAVAQLLKCTARVEATRAPASGAPEGVCYFTLTPAVEAARSRAAPAFPCAEAFSYSGTGTSVNATESPLALSVNATALCEWVAAVNGSGAPGADAFGAYCGGGNATAAAAAAAMTPAQRQAATFGRGCLAPPRFLPETPIAPEGAGGAAASTAALARAVGLAVGGIALAGVLGVGAALWFVRRARRQARSSAWGGVGASGGSGIGGSGSVGGGSGAALPRSASSGSGAVATGGSRYALGAGSGSAAGGGGGGGFYGGVSGGGGSGGGGVPAGVVGRQPPLTQQLQLQQQHQQRARQAGSFSGVGGYAGPAGGGAAGATGAAGAQPRTNSGSSWRPAAGPFDPAGGASSGRERSLL